MKNNGSNYSGHPKRGDKMKVICYRVLWRDDEHNQCHKDYPTEIDARLAEKWLIARSADEIKVVVVLDEPGGERQLEFVN